ncbi:MAG TPA: hypothetical protein VFU21_02340 [Kofleriaceae bacterium]|nr:hypothetical protein [Kofleriaceae bacterium]
MPQLDPARAAAIAEPDLGPPPPPGPLEMRVPTLRISPRRPPSELTPDGNGRFRVEEGPVTAHVERDGRVAFEDKKSIGFELPLITGGAFELTDLAMRMAGQDPYSSRKMALLDRTRAERMQLAAAETSSNLKDAVVRTPAALERIWRAPGDLAGKRRLLFTLWDECAETGSAEVLASSRAVRAAIVAFIRRRLPRGSRAGYRSRELDALNARRTSRERFEPYAR